jgi:virulence-associated protein VagC
MKTVYELKVFRNGGSNAVRIPAAVQLKDQVLYLEVDSESQDLSLYKEKPQKFKRLFELLDQHGPISDAEWGDERDESEWPERESLKSLDRHLK